MSTSDFATFDDAYTSIDAETIETLRMTLRGPVLLEGDDGYDEARTLWNGMHDRHPALIVRAAGAADVIDAVNFARDHRLLLAVKGGGHSLPGYSSCSGGMMLDLPPMNGIWVNPQRRTARVQGGALLADLDRETQAFGLATPSGNVSHTGVAGLTLGGGIGHLRRKYGLAIDNLLSVDIVTADGELRRASADEEPDLFWAVRGGGGNFGVVTSFEFQLHPVRPFVFGLTVAYPRQDAATRIRARRDYNSTAPNDVSGMIVLGCAPSMPPIPEEIQGLNGLTLIGAHSGDPDEGARVMQPLRELGTPMLDLSSPIPYRILQKVGDEFEAPDPNYYGTGVLLPELSDDVIDIVVRNMDTSVLPTQEAWMQIWHLGGKMGRVDPAATAFRGRRAEYMFDIMPRWSDPADTEKSIAWVRDFARELEQYALSEYYVNLSDTDSGPGAGARRAYGDNYERLARIKSRYDAENLFRMNQNVQPAGR